MNFLPEWIHYRVEVMKVSFLRWYYQSRFHKALSKESDDISPFDLDEFYPHITAKELEKILWYNFSGKNRWRFLIIGDEIYSDTRPFNPKEIDEIGKSMWIMIVNPNWTSHILIPTLQRWVTFDKGHYKQWTISISDEHGIDPKIIEKIWIKHLSAANRIFTSTVDIHTLLRLLKKIK